MKKWNTCLKTSLVLYYFLNRYNTPACLCIGVKKERDQLLGHSWIEMNEAPANVANHDDFIVIYRYPPS